MQFFKLQKRDKKGVSVQAHLEQVAETSGIVPPELEAAQLPPSLLWLFGLYADLVSGRSGIAPFSWQEFRAWTATRRLSLSGYQVDILRSFDRAFVRVYGGAK